VYIRYTWQGNHHTYGHIRCRYTVLANPSYILCNELSSPGAWSYMHTYLLLFFVTLDVRTLPADSLCFVCTITCLHTYLLLSFCHAGCAYTTSRQPGHTCIITCSFSLSRWMCVHYQQTAGALFAQLLVRTPTCSFSLSRWMCVHYQQTAWPYMHNYLFLFFVTLEVRTLPADSRCFVCTITCLHTYLLLSFCHAGCAYTTSRQPVLCFFYGPCVFCACDRAGLAQGSS
jgi:hypothetical protein